LKRQAQSLKNQRKTLLPGNHLLSNFYNQPGPCFEKWFPVF
jgi:hypothetical protein